MSHQSNVGREADRGELQPGRRDDLNLPGRMSAAAKIYAAASILDAAILCLWGAHHLQLFFSRAIDPSLQAYRHDGLCLLALGLCALLTYGFAHYRERLHQAAITAAEAGTHARLRSLEDNVLELVREYQSAPGGRRSCVSAKRPARPNAVAFTPSCAIARKHRLESRRTAAAGG